MRTGRPEALLLFRKWLEESTPLYCEVRFSILAACFDLRLTAVSEEEVRARSADSISEVVVPLNRAVSFGYADTRVTPSESVDFEAGLVVFFDDPEDTDDFDSLTFMERRTDE